MAYDAYGRPLRSNGEPGYFDTHEAVPDYTSYYSADHHNPSSRRRDESPFHRTSPPIHERMNTVPERTEPPGLDGVSPELIAAITEKVKKELFEHLKQTGTNEEQSRAPPMQRDPSNKSSSTSSPPPTARRVYTPPSPTQFARPSNPVPPMEPVRSPPGSPLDKPSGVRFSDRSLPTRPIRVPTSELSTIDQKWGRLFDTEGNPTKRLGQFLRGLANHIIVEFSPKKSIVVTPSKMAEYYGSYSLDKEPHPLLTIFRAQSNEHISRLYQDLGCQHHLVQEDSRSAPLVPALTPVGFAHWMTIHILAYPEEESQRLAKVVLGLPIDADGDLVDGKPERLPKQISRHLLPEKTDIKSKQLLENAILNFLDDLGSSNRRKASITSPSLSRHSSTSQSQSRPRAPVEIHQARTSPTTAKANPLERERKPYSGAPASESSSTEEPVKIERDRAPYTAKEGAGKIYTEHVNPNIQNRPNRANSVNNRDANSASNRAPPDKADTRPGRAPSTAGQNPLRRGRRTSSPPLKNWSQSQPSDINSSKYGPNPSSSSSSFTTQSQTFSPGSFGSNGNFPPPPGPPPIDIHRRRENDRPYRRDTDDERWTGEFNSPRDAEKWDRYQESQREGERDRFGSYDRGSISIDPREVRGAPAEEWYRDKPRGEYDTFRRY